MTSLGDFRRLLASRIGRIGAGLTALVSLTVVLWPDASWAFNIERFIPFLSAMCVWLWSELDGAGEPHPNDIALFQKLLLTIKPSERRMLIEHNMGDSFYRKAFDGLSDVVETWKGPSFEFQDREMKQKWSEVRQLLADFMWTIVEYTGPLPTNPDLSTIKTDEDLATGTRSLLTVERTKELNKAAHVAAERLDDFERLARKKLRI